MFNKRHGGLAGPRALIWTLLFCVYQLSSGGKIGGRLLQNKKKQKKKGLGTSLGKI